MKIDTGYHRTGILSSDISTVESILRSVKNSKYLKPVGFLTHAGHTYKAKEKEEIIRIHNDTVAQLQNLKTRFSKEFPDLIISVGDTPSCSVAEDFSGVDEIRPGNFVFYDVMQAQIGSCKIKDISVILACPVVAKHPERNELVIYGGAVHLSKEFVIDKAGKNHYGLVVRFDGEKWSDPIPGFVCIVTFAGARNNKDDNGFFPNDQYRRCSWYPSRTFLPNCRPGRFLSNHLRKNPVKNKKRLSVRQYE